MERGTEAGSTMIGARSASGLSGGDGRWMLAWSTAALYGPTYLVVVLQSRG